VARIKSTDPYGAGFFDDSPPPPPGTETTSSDLPVAGPSETTAANSRRPRPSGTAAGTVTEVRTTDGGEATRTNGSRTDAAPPANPVPMPTIRLNADIDRELHRRLRLRVAADDTTIADFVRTLLERELR
jgi:hypothetical protein